ncbi:g185 [Coccomyxa viridis]|uniref:G185 protein n=1 Tax=Coccomyxa viridis TaxID=1274662 RepID=A0ABP1FF51_9CHLO
MPENRNSRRRRAGRKGSNINASASSTNTESAAASGPRPSGPVAPQGTPNQGQPLKHTQQDNEPQDKAYRDLKKKVLQDEADVEDQEAALKVRRKLQKDRNRRLKWVINTLLKGPAALLRRKLRASLRKFAIEIAGPIKNFPGMETALSKWGDLYKLLEKHQRVAIRKALQNPEMALIQTTKTNRDMVEATDERHTISPDMDKMQRGYLVEVINRETSWELYEGLKAAYLKLVAKRSWQAELAWLGGFDLNL